MLMQDPEAARVMPTIDPSIEKFPYCIVWTPIPCITWFLPFIGKFFLLLFVFKQFQAPYIQQFMLVWHDHRAHWYR